MAAIGPALPWIMGGLQVAGTIQQANAQRAAGKSAQAEADYEANALNVQAGQEQAAAQRTMLDKQRDKNLALSTVQARSAASGGGALDPSVVNIMGDLEAQGTLNEQTALYTGDSRAAALKQQGALKTYQGQVANKNAGQKANATLLAGATSMFSKFAPGPSPTDDYDVWDHIDDVG